MMLVTVAKMPRQNSPMRTYFWRRGICSLQSSGMGTAMRTMSVAMLMAALEKVRPVLSMHVPWAPTTNIQYVSIGQQVKMEEKKVQRP